MRTFLLTAAAALFLPQTAKACYEMASEVWFCAGGTVWETAERGGWALSGALDLEDYSLYFDDEYYGKSLASAFVTREQQLELYLEVEASGEDSGVATVHSEDTLELKVGTVLRSFQRYAVEGEEEALGVVMIADIVDQRLAINLDALKDTDWETLDRMTRDVLDRIALTCADSATCIDASTPAEAFATPTLTSD